MDNNIEWMRYKLCKAPRYDTPKWHNKVMQMKPAQVIAIFKKFEKDGLFDEKRPKLNKNIEYRQMSIFDFMDDNGVIDFSKQRESVFMEV